MAKQTLCSCGEVGSHIIIKRKTADGYDALLWNDGALTDRMGNGKRPSAKKLQKRIKLMGDASILTWNELLSLA